MLEFSYTYMLYVSVFLSRVISPIIFHSYIPYISYSTFGSYSTLGIIVLEDPVEIYVLLYKIYHMKEETN